MTQTSRPIGELLRHWRQRRRISQLDLSIEAEVSTRHLSFVETGRSRPSPDLILRLAEHLAVPLAERNTMLLAGGYAPAYPAHDLNDAALLPVRAAIRRILDGHGTYPAVLVGHQWQLVDANAATAMLTADAAPHLLEPPVNVLRLSLHPDGMAPRIGNLAEWRAHLLERLRREAEAADDQSLRDLHEELKGYPGDDGTAPPPGEGGRVVVPLRYDYRGHDLSFLSTTTVFGTPLDVTIAGLAIEAFFPADEETSAALSRISP